MNTRAYPLTWPDGWARTPASQRKHGHFNKLKPNAPGENITWRRVQNITVADAIDRILKQLSMMGIDRDELIVSTNVPTRLDGLPKSGASQPIDPGGAVYWRNGGGVMKAIAIDIYFTVADNLAAIAATLEAMRTIERHGGAQVQERVFRGFLALPATTEPNWWDVLQVQRNAGAAVIEASYKRLARIHHPDMNAGSQDAMARVNVAYQRALAELKG